MINTNNYIFSLKQLISCSNFTLLQINTLLEKNIGFKIVNDSDINLTEKLIHKLSLNNEIILNIDEIDFEHHIFVSTSIIIPSFMMRSKKIYLICDEETKPIDILDNKNITSVISFYSPLDLPDNCVNNLKFLKKYIYILPTYRKLSINFKENTKPLIIYDEDTIDNSKKIILNSLISIGVFDFIKFSALFDFQFKEINTTKILSFIDCKTKDIYIKSCSNVITVNITPDFKFNDMLYRNNTLNNEDTKSLRSTITLFTKEESKSLRNQSTDEVTFLNNGFFDKVNLELNSFLNSNNFIINKNTFITYFLYILLIKNYIISPNLNYFKLLFNYAFKDNSLGSIFLINEIYNSDSTAFNESLMTIFSKSTDKCLKDDTSYYYTKYVVRSQVIHLLNQDNSEFLSNDDILYFILRTSNYHNTLGNLSILFYLKGNTSNVDVVIQNCPNQSSKNLLILNILIACTLKNDLFNYKKYSEILDFSNHHTNLDIVFLQKKILDFIRFEHNGINFELLQEKHFKVQKEFLLFNDIILVLLHIYSKIDNFKLPNEMSSYIEKNFINIDKLNYSQFQFLNLDSTSFDKSIFDTFN